jgi:hypothetical protein
MPAIRSFPLVHKSFLIAVQELDGVFDGDDVLPLINGFFSNV